MVMAAHNQRVNDRPEVAHRRARLKELLDRRFNGEQKNLLSHIHTHSGVDHNQGEMSGLVSGTKSFGEKKAASLCALIGLSRGWFDLPKGSGFEPHPLEQPPGVCESQNPAYAVTGDAESTLLRAFRLAEPAVRKAWLHQARGILEDHNTPSQLTGEEKPSPG